MFVQKYVRVTIFVNIKVLFTTLVSYILGRYMNLFVYIRLYTHEYIYIYIYIYIYVCVCTHKYICVYS